MTTSPYFKDYAAHDNATIVVSSTDELNAAIEDLAGTTGGTILLEGTGGPYRLDARDVGEDADSAVLITSLDPDQPAQLKQIYIDNSAYLSVTDVTIDSDDYGDERSAYLDDIYVKSGTHLQFVDLTMTSDAEEMLGLDADTIKGQSAVYLRNASDVLFADSSLSNYYHGISLVGVENTIVTGNDISALQGDGIRGGGVDNLLISDNHIHDFLGATNELNHPDMIQLWTGFPEDMTNSNVTITGNLLDAGDGPAAQGILIQNEAFREDGHPLEGVYGQNLTITENVVHSGMYHGISVVGYEGVEVANNSVLWNEGAALIQKAGEAPDSNPPWILIRDSLAIEAVDNVAVSVRIDSEDQSETNYFLNYDDPTAPNYAYSHVVGLAPDGETDIYDLQFRPDSPLNGAYGAEASTWAPSDAPVNAVISQQPNLEDRAAVELSARYSTVDGQQVDPETMQFLWTLGDGTVLEGMEVSPAFDTPGLHEVQLEVIAPDGSSDTATKSVEALSNTLFEEDFGTTTAFGDAVDIIDPNGQAFATDGVFTLDGDSVLEVQRGNPEFDNLQTLSLDVSFKPDAFDKNGWLVKWSQALDLRITEDKGLWLKVTTDTAVHEMKTEGDLLALDDWADISVDFDAPAGVLSLSLNDEELLSTEVDGVISGRQYDLSLGESRGRSAVGEVDYFAVTTPRSAVLEDVGDPEEPDDEETPPPEDEDDTDEGLFSRLGDFLASWFFGRQAAMGGASSEETAQTETASVALDDVTALFTLDPEDQDLGVDEDDPADASEDLAA